MACVVTPIAEAVVTTIVGKIVKKQEAKYEKVALSRGEKLSDDNKIPFSRKISWLSKLLWGGSALLVFEHVWHGEIVPFFPFLTAASDPSAAAVMKAEMASVGGAMSLLLTGVWCVMLGVCAYLERKEKKAIEEK